MRFTNFLGRSLDVVPETQFLKGFFIVIACKRWFQSQFPDSSPESSRTSLSSVWFAGTTPEVVAIVSAQEWSAHGESRLFFPKLSGTLCESSEGVKLPRGRGEALGRPCCFWGGRLVREVPESCLNFGSRRSSGKLREV